MRRAGGMISYQSPRGAVERMTMVPAELGVDTLERRVPLGLRLVDTAIGNPSAFVFFFRCFPEHCKCPRESLERRSVLPVPVGLLALVVLRRVLRFCKGVVSMAIRFRLSGIVRGSTHSPF